MTPAMTTMRKVGIVIAALVAAAVAFGLVYGMPRATKAVITGTDVKRMDRTTKEGGGTTRDVRFIYATEVDTDKAIAFRNEDNVWSLKFDSGDIAAEASQLAKTDVAEIALIRYYGVRIKILDTYPNVLSIREVEPDYVYIPWFNMIVLVVLLVLFVWGGIKIRRFFRRAKAKITDRPVAS